MSTAHIAPETSNGSAKLALTRGLAVPNEEISESVPDIERPESGSRIAGTGISEVSTDDGLPVDVASMLRSAGLGLESSDSDVPLTAEQTDVVKEVANSVVVQIGNNDLADVQGRWATGFSKIYRPGMDVNALIQAVLREAYMQNTEDLKFYAQKVSMLNDLKKEVRDYLGDLRTALGEQAGRDDDAPLVGGDLPKYEFDATPRWNEETGKYEAVGLVDTGEKITTKAELEAHITNMEEFLNSVGDDAQLANVDLQNMLQRQQQTLQTMSNTSKMCHDTSMAIIRKISG